MTNSRTTQPAADRRQSSHHGHRHHRSSSNDSFTFESMSLSDSTAAAVHQTADTPHLTTPIPNQSM
jgi:hypothetical protein